jgi:hypothetical protein
VPDRTAARRDTVVQHAVFQLPLHRCQAEGCLTYGLLLLLAESGPVQQIRVARDRNASFRLRTGKACGAPR